MSRKVIKVGLNSRSLDNAIKELRAYKKWLSDKTKEFIDELGKIGLEAAGAKFKDAVYDGYNDVSVNVESRGDTHIAVVAVGSSVLFIEFGTGVVYADDHPDKSAGIAARGTYGKGHGKQRTWGFYGDDKGTNGVYATVDTKDGKVEKIPHVVLTHGNPANMSMYSTVQDLRDRVEEVAKRVYTR